MVVRRAISRPWRVLAGLDPIDFELEKELSYFKIKLWLTGFRNLRPAFASARVIFLLHKLQYRFEEYDSNYSWRMRDILRHRSYAELFDHCVLRGRLIDVLTVKPLSSEVQQRFPVRKHLDYEAEYTLARLSLWLNHKDKSRGSADRYMEKVHTQKGLIGLSVADRFKRYRSPARSAYIAAAASVIPQLFDFDDDAIRRLPEQIPDDVSFQVFCGRVRTASKAFREMGDSECAGDEEMAGWTGLEAVSFADLPSIPPNTSDGPKVRRSATETSIGKASRKRP